MWVPVERPKPPVSRESALEAMDLLLHAFRTSDVEAIEALTSPIPVRLLYNPIPDRAEVARIFGECSASDVEGTFPYNDGTGQVVRLALDCVQFEFRHTLRDQDGNDVPQPVPEGIDFWFDGERFRISPVSIVTRDAELN